MAEARGIVFDFADTLIASDRARIRELRRLVGPGVDLRQVRQKAQEWYDRYRRGECTWEEQRRARWIAIGVAAEDAAAVDDDYRRHYDSIRLRVGVREMLNGFARCWTSPRSSQQLHA